MPYLILFVCLGNICRSPLAEAVFAHLVQERGLSTSFEKIDSAGTAGYHVGEEPDERTVATCKKHGVPISSLCRQLQARLESLCKSDFDEFDVIVGMDTMNMANIEKIRPKNSKAKVTLFGVYGDGKVIQDPYYGGPGGFEKTYQQCLAYSEGLLADLGFGKDEVGSAGSESGNGNGRL
ncbi:BQ2448_3871 [Microbotryum intermedium]|uniref:BQ2448_3871 protein n=1 Tax=Microbotryum intermedium TaxID=269621 RepID=A0A238FKC0_9BASI|nr:BQ2448_3871 [Microbotryum intermedium]